MKPLVIYILEVLACSGILFAAYALLLERRVRFRWCRAYLLFTTVAAGVIPLLRIPVWAGEVIEIPTLPSLTEWSGPVAISPAEPLITSTTICLAIYLLGAAVIAILLLGQMVRIRALRRDATVTDMGAYSLVLTRKKVSSFSFFGSIYVWQNTPSDQLPAILMHEASHIAHRHSLERVAMECLKTILWWNPFVWITARLLTEAEEFEADSDVLESGYDMNHYMNTIFKQLFGYSPEIANCLRNSLTKKRFQMMTTKTHGRFALLRLAGTLPALLGLLCAFGFTSRAAVLVSTPPAAEASPTTTVTVKAANQTVIRQVSAPADTTAKMTPKENNSFTEVFRDKRIVWIVDGKRVDNISNLNAEEIASIYIWKSPEKIAQYGDSASDGVIEVITKQGEFNGAKADGTAISIFSDKDTTSSQESTISMPATQNTDNPDQPYLVTEVMPKFQGGDLSAFRTWVQNHVVFPEEAIKQDLQGRVVVSFVVQRDGTMSSIEVLQSPDKCFSAEAVRVLKSTPADGWVPGIQRGKPVNVKYTLPIDFRQHPKE